jgi:hypothetical protein
MPCPCQVLGPRQRPRRQGDGIVHVRRVCAQLVELLPNRDLRGAPKNMENRSNASSNGEPAAKAGSVTSNAATGGSVPASTAPKAPESGPDTALGPQLVEIIDHAEHEIAEVDVAAVCCRQGRLAAVAALRRSARTGGSGVMWHLRRQHHLAGPALDRADRRNVCAAHGFSPVGFDGSARRFGPRNQIAHGARNDSEIPGNPHRPSGNSRSNFLRVTDMPLPPRAGLHAFGGFTKRRLRGARLQ